jgi:hypothetical protein
LELSILVVSKKINLLFRVVGRISKYSGVDATSDSVRTCDDDTIFHHMDKVGIKYILPDRLH